MQGPYSYTANGGIVAADGISISADPRNGDYVYLKAVEARGEITIEPYVEPASPTPTITRLQCRKWLLANLGKTKADVDALIAAIPDDTQRELARMEWEDSTEMHHDHPLVQQFALVWDIPDVGLAFREAKEL